MGEIKKPISEDEISKEKRVDDIVQRYRKMTGDNRAFFVDNDLLIFLDNEVKRYREKVKELQKALDSMSENKISIDISSEVDGMTIRVRENRR